jgi:hypothetical protein
MTERFPEEDFETSPTTNVFLLLQIFNAVLTHHILTVYKHARVISTLIPGKAQQLFERILLTRKIYETRKRELIPDEKYGFRPRHSSFLQFDRLVEKTTRKFGENKLTGAVFLDVDKPFHTVWIDCPIYKLTLLYFRSYIHLSISSYLRCRISTHNSKRPRRLIDERGMGYLRVD